MFFFFTFINFDPSKLFDFHFFEFVKWKALSPHFQLFVDPNAVEDPTILALTCRSHDSSYNIYIFFCGIKAIILYYLLTNILWSLNVYSYVYVQDTR